MSFELPSFRRFSMARLAVAAAAIVVLAPAHLSSRGLPTLGVGVEDTRPIAFRNVHVISMEDARVRRWQNVIVGGDEIRAVGDADSVRIPDGARIVPSDGLYLMPGLADMHVHIEEEGELRQYVASGFTTLRNMRGERRHLDWRARIQAGDLLGPTLYTAGAFLDGDPPYWRGSILVRDAADAERVVSEQAQAGYDFIKVYSLLSAPAYAGVLQAARRRGIGVAGHVPVFAGLDAALVHGQRSTEHLYGYVDAVEAPDSPVRGRWAWRRLFGGIPIDRSRLPALAARVRGAGTWTCPTLALFEQWLPPEARAEGSDPELRSLGLRNRRAVLKALADAGAGLIFGTDTARLHGMQPGRAAVAELVAMTEAGLTSYQALRSATVDAARFLDRDTSVGTIAAGKRADLVLLRANPLEDVRNVSGVAGVMSRGRLLEPRDFTRDAARRQDRPTEPGALAEGRRLPRR